MAITLEWIAQSEDGLEWIGPFDGVLTEIAPIFFDDLGVTDFVDDRGLSGFIDDRFLRVEDDT